MSAQDDYVYPGLLDDRQRQDQHMAMCDEIDRLRARIEELDTECDNATDEIIHWMGIVKNLRGIP